jgi:hypothetical protein
LVWRKLLNAEDKNKGSDLLISRFFYYLHWSYDFRVFILREKGRSIKYIDIGTCCINAICLKMVSRISVGPFERHLEHLLSVLSGFNSRMVRYIICGGLRACGFNRAFSLSRVSVWQFFHIWVFF